MIVHLGVIMIAIAIAASRTYGTSGEVTLRAGEKGLFKGHTVELVAIRKVYTGTGEERRLKQTLADVRVDGGRIDTPALTKFSAAGMTVGTPSVQTGLLRDVYLTLVQPPQTDGGRAVIGIYFQPMTVWLWVGGLIMALGTLLAAIPGRRRRPSDPTSTLDAGRFELPPEATRPNAGLAEESTRTDDPERREPVAVP